MIDWLRKAAKKVPWHLASRFTLLLGLWGPGALLTFQAHKFENIGVLSTVSWLIPVWWWGILLLIGGFLLLVARLREFGNMLGFIIYGVFSFCAIFTILGGHPYSPLLFTLPAVSMFYAEAMRVALNRRLG